MVSHQEKGTTLEGRSRRSGSSTGPSSTSKRRLAPAWSPAGFFALVRPIRWLLIIALLILGALNSLRAHFARPLSPPPPPPPRTQPDFILLAAPQSSRNNSTSDRNKTTALQDTNLNLLPGITAVLPFSTTDKEVLSRTLGLLLSLGAHLTIGPGAVSRLLVVTELHEDYKLVRSWASGFRRASASSTPPLQVDVVFAPEELKTSTSGSIIPVSISEKVDTDFYLLLDPKGASPNGPVSLEQLLPRGKGAAVQLLEPRARRDIDAGVWIMADEALRGPPGSACQAEDAQVRSMLPGGAPALLSTAISRSLLERLGDLKPRSDGGRSGR